jgi:hypothetical protein
MVTKFETQSERLKFENKYRGISYLLKKLLKEGDITSKEYSDSLIEMERMKEEDQKKIFD